MKNSNENLLGGTWLLTFLQRQKRSILLFRGLCVNSVTFSL